MPKITYTEGCISNITSTIDITRVNGLQEELEKLKAENTKLTEWFYWGKYSAK